MFSSDLAIFVYFSHKSGFCGAFDLFKLIYIIFMYGSTDRLCGLVVGVPEYRFRGPGFDSRRYQIF
jgi:hypothetical protein